jgi:hypothetical protein
MENRETDGPEEVRGDRHPAETVKPGEAGTVQSESFLEPQAPPSARDSQAHAASPRPRPTPPTPEALSPTSVGVGVDQGPAGRVPQRPGQAAEFTGEPGARPHVPRNVKG